jgi:tripartite-type tricarboxylate transporter receptor subunit TctC
VQTAAGSSLDVMARLVTEQLAQIWGQQPIVVNQAGAGGLLAARATAASTPDGYTLFMAGGSVFVVLPEVQPGVRRERIRADRLHRRAALCAARLQQARREFGA